MRTIYLLIHHSSSTYGTSKPLKCFARREDAEALIDVLVDVIKGNIEIIEISLDEPPAPIPAAHPGYKPMWQPSFVSPGVAVSGDHAGAVGAS